MNLGFLASHNGSNMQAILDALLRHEVDTVVLAGYMKKLGPKTLSHFAGRILNVHPALLPKFGGKGMYGIHVHEAVLAARVLQREHTFFPETLQRIATGQLNLPPTD